MLREGKCLCQYFAKYHLQNASFLFPALGLNACDLWQLTETTHFLSQRKLRGKQSLEPFRMFLCRAIADPSKATCAGCNRLRRCLPSAAHALWLPGADAQAIPSWIQVLCSIEGGQAAHQSRPPLMFQLTQWRARSSVVVGLGLRALPCLVRVFCVGRMSLDQDKR